MLHEVKEVRRRLQALADPKIGAFTKALYHSPYRFLGVDESELRKIARHVARKHRDDVTLRSPLAIAKRLWNSRVHEEMTTAIHILAALDRWLENKHWALFKEWMKRVRSWDHCDGIAAWLIGALVARDRSWIRVLRHWARSRNIWDRRAAVLGALLRVRQMSDIEAAFFVCEPLMRDRVPVVELAVGMILREAMIVNREGTRDFLDRWKDKASPLILRAARGRLPSLRAQVPR